MHDAIKKPVEFSKFNILYGENGRGKTTLTSIFRSLENNKPADIEERRTINGSHAPEVDILVDGAPRTYSAGKWNAMGARLLIFDAAFVDQNVYSGAAVDPDHRKNLHYFAIGEGGVKLAREVDTLAQSISKATNNLNAAEAAIADKMADRSITVEDFLMLDPLGEPDKVIEEKQKYLLALQQSTTVAELKLPTQLPAEPVTVDLVSEILRRSFEGISTDVEKLVRRHIAESAPSEKWVELGVSRMDQNCPFCGRDNKAVLLLEAYKTYFGEGYRRHRSNIQTAVDGIRVALSSESATKLVNLALSNSAIFERWARFLPFDYPLLDTDKILAATHALRASLEGLLTSKESNPLELVEMTEQNKQLFANYDAQLTLINSYNECVRALSRSCEQFRAQLSAGDVKEAQRDLVEAKNRKNRHTPELKQLCDVYKGAKKAKQALVKQKDEAKDRLDKYTASLLSKYQESINDYIKRCGGNFKIAGMATAYPGGLPRVEYCIKVFGEEIDLTNKKPNKIGFKTAMGQGDKNTLAFAFFLARLQHSPELAESTVVFDDPLSSLDSNRRQFTRAQVLAVAQKAKQILILTHDEETAARLAKDAPTGAIPTSDRSYWEFRTVRDYTELHALDVGTLAKLPYIRNWEVLNNFAQLGAHPKEHDAIVRAIRPCLEDNLKFRFPDEIKPDATLGKIVKQIRESSAQQQLHSMLPKLDVLEQIDAYTTQHSHGDEVHCAPEEISQVELRTHVRLALELMRGLPSSKAAKASS